VNLLACVKGSAFWDITPYNPLKVNRRFGRKPRLQLQGPRISKQETKVKKAAILHAGLLVGLFSNLKMGAKYSSETSVDF
jgi:hypothetical protein